MTTQAGATTRNAAHDPHGKHAKTQTMDDARMEKIMGRLLQVGVLLAATVVAAGGGLYLSAHAVSHPNYRTFTARPVLLRHPETWLAPIIHGNPASILDLGIVLLVATPICRVLFGVIAFAAQRDRLYVAVSLTVLAVLMFGILHAS